MISGRPTGPDLSRPPPAGRPCLRRVKRCAARAHAPLRCHAVALTDEQRAMLQLLLEGGQSYDDISSLLGITPDEVRSRARAALTEIGGADPDSQVALSDYLLGQADPIGRADVAGRPQPLPPPIRPRRFHQRLHRRPSHRAPRRSSLFSPSVPASRPG